MDIPTADDAKAAYQAQVSDKWKDKIEDYVATAIRANATKLGGGEVIYIYPPVYRSLDWSVEYWKAHIKDIVVELRNKGYEVTWAHVDMSLHVSVSEGIEDKG